MHGIELQSVPINKWNKFPLPIVCGRTMKKIHYISGLTISVFVGLHLFNHSWSFFGASEHIELMHSLRLIYRNIVVETILLIAVAVQITSGIYLFKRSRKTAISRFEKIHIWSGLYLAAFLIFHVLAVVIGRFYLQLDTNFYFGVAGLNTFPVNLFFIPYYGLAIISFFGHIAAVHRKKMTLKVLGLTPRQQSIGILLFGVTFTVFIFYGLTNQFDGVEIPAEYGILTGK